MVIMAINKFKEGYWYKYTNPDKSRPEKWDDDGEMDFMLDGKWHQCKSIANRTCASFHGSPRPDYRWDFEYRTGFKFMEESESTTKPSTQEEHKMELKNIKKENLEEAKKQYDAERMNAEVKVAKAHLQGATDELNRLDRKIKSLQEEKKPWLEVLKSFK